MIGIFNPCDSPFAKDTPDNKVPINPGPCVTARPSRLERDISASFNVSDTIWFNSLSCSLDAISGTTPPNFL